MSANPIRRRAVSAVVAAALSLALLGGCTTGQKPPSNYAGAEDNFLEGCTQRATEDNTKVDDEGQTDTTKIASPKTYCQCVFDAISDPQDGIEYSEFKKIQSRMQDEGGALPESYLKVVDTCDPSETAGS